MYINGEQADLIRAKAVKLVTDVLDFTRGDHTYKEVCKGYTPGYGTSCTFLPHWMLLMLGVSGQNMSKGVPKPGVPPKPRPLINRDDLARGTKLVAGDGVSVIANSPAFVPMKPNLQAYPQPGDIVIIQKEPYHQPDEHVFVFLGELAGDLWDTGESGQVSSNAPDGTLEGKRKKREMRITDRSMIAKATPDKPVDRKVQGWLDISKLDYVSGSV